MQKMIERLTREQMAEKYPSQWLGITNVKYKNDDGITMEEADIIYTNKSEDELIEIEIDSLGSIMAWFTNEHGLPLGLAGIN